MKCPWLCYDVGKRFYGSVAKVIAQARLINECERKISEEDMSVKGYSQGSMLVQCAVQSCQVVSADGSPYPTGKRQMGCSVMKQRASNGKVQSVMVVVVVGQVKPSKLKFEERSSRQHSR